MLAVFWYCKNDAQVRLWYNKKTFIIHMKVKRRHDSGAPTASRMILLWLESNSREFMPEATYLVRVTSCRLIYFRKGKMSKKDFKGKVGVRESKGSANCSEAVDGHCSAQKPYMPFNKTVFGLIWSMIDTSLCTKIWAISNTLRKHELIKYWLQ